jgi:hypothetical protein
LGLWSWPPERARGPLRSLQLRAQAGGVEGSPAMVAGLSNHVRTIEEIVGLLDTAEKKAA